MKEKRRRQGVPKAHVSATYKKITLTVPEAPVSEAMPAAMTFYVDTRFTTAQVNRIRTLIAGALGFWREHYQQLDEQGSSRYQSCCKKYARFNLAPVWFEEKLANGSAAASVQMDGFTAQIAANGFGRAAKAYIMYKKSNSLTVVKGVNASDPETNSLTVTFNPIALDNTGVGNATYMGSLAHAWLRREGYRHPAGKFTSYFAGEASMCVMRGNRDKVPGQKDSTFTKYLD
ncbi:hypothetical protein [Paenibacillus eucommiae]|uniref:Capsid protein n=1 Tax=Paenibacillus eucommiae TaxID=1355755 RepID=A0ABS4JBT9_9BACL|nr:hypothetical protein [Paenibacillus eucommiae]MBP1996691.1 hypothetical protein [Paenibacillus eucommiae]